MMQVMNAITPFMKQPRRSPTPASRAPVVFIERDRLDASTQEELDMSNNFTSHFSADDAALVLIDFQPQMFMGVESHDRNAMAVRSRHAAIRAVPTLATHGGAVDAAKAGKTEERSDQALAKPAYDVGAATLEKLAASIAHEINQPLTAIVLNGDACLQWLDREMPDLTKARSAASKMISDANRAWEIVRRLRALARKADPEYRSLNINDLVTETIPPVCTENSNPGVVVMKSAQDGA
jgi:nitrogen-specific signal transduction histidine kinase